MPEHSDLRPLSVSQVKMLERATSRYHGALADSPATIRYLQARGIEERVADTFRLGVVPSRPEAGHERFAGWLAIPYLLGDGTVVSMRFRCLEAHDHREYYHGKYMSLPDDPGRMFNVGAIASAGDELHVTEGEFDAMVLTQIGLHAVAIPGASGFQMRHERMLAGFNPIHVWGDPDEAGGKFIATVTRALPSAVGVRLRAGDVSDTYLLQGKDGLLALLKDEEEGADDERRIRELLHA